MASVDVAGDSVEASVALEDEASVELEDTVPFVEDWAWVVVSEDSRIASPSESELDVVDEEETVSAEVDTVDVVEVDSVELEDTSSSLPSL